MFKEGLSSSDVLGFITDFLPWDVPEWLAFMIFGFLAVVVFYIVVKVGDVIFKILVVLCALLFVYMLLTGKLSSCGSAILPELHQAISLL